MIQKFESPHMILEVFNDRVVIGSKGSGFFSPRGLSGKKEIPFTSIKAIQFKEAGFLNAGFIQFTIHGGKDAGSGLLDAVKDENSFLFGTEHNDSIRKLKDFLMEKISKEESSRALVGSVADELAKLKKLQNEGLLTQEEFEELKIKIMKNI